MDNYPPTYFIDIDGTLINHKSNDSNSDNSDIKIFLSKLERLNTKIIIITGRKESERPKVVKMLSDMGISFDEMIMGCNRGSRILINDSKPVGDVPTACGINVERNNFDWASIIDPNSLIERTIYGWRHMLDYKHKIYKLQINQNESWWPNNRDSGITREWRVISGSISVLFTRGEEFQENIYDSSSEILIFNDDSVDEIINQDEKPTIILERIL
jgi:hydroxymethylpyrimidine pyrophosphatase-like HAD family hydrolase